MSISSSDTERLVRSTGIGTRAVAITLVRPCGASRQPSD
jgi:hypothetical protein